MKFFTMFHTLVFKSALVFRFLQKLWLLTFFIRSISNKRTEDSQEKFGDEFEAVIFQF